MCCGVHRVRCCSGSLAGPLWRGRPDLSTDFRWQTNLVQVDWIDVISLKELSETLLKLLMGFSVMVGMACACYVEPELVLHLPFPQHHRSRVSTSFLSACRIHWQPGTYSVVTVRSSKNALIFLSYSNSMLPQKFDVNRWSSQSRCNDLHTYPPEHQQSPSTVVFRIYTPPFLTLLFHPSRQAVAESQSVGCLYKLNNLSVFLPTDLGCEGLVLPSYISG